MSLPTVETLQDCANYYKVIEPFLPQLYDLPQKLRATPLDRDALAQLYAETNPLVSAAALSVFMGSVFFITAETNRNYSQVDRMWSILPAAYIAHFSLWARLVGETHDRIDLAAIAAIVWAGRLTFNYWRKGGYTIGSEDYRWEIVRSWPYMHPLAFSVFNLTFIAFIQSFLLFFFSAVPTYVIFIASKLEPEVSKSDKMYFGIMLALVAIEFVSDDQQWEYQNAKKKYQKTAQVPQGFDQDELDRGFITSGLWAYSRHPNFIAEQLIWVVFYEWSRASSETLASFAGVGCLGLIVLFQGSTMLTEAITASKYPEYKEYQKQVDRFLPTNFSKYKAPTNQSEAIQDSGPIKGKQPK